MKFYFIFQFISQICVLFVVLLSLHTSFSFIYVQNPLECQIQSNRGVGTICDFDEIISFNQDTSKIIAHPTNAFGQTIKEKQVHSVRFHKSIFDKIPNEIFNHFGNEFDGVQSINFNTGRLYSIEESSFKDARDLVYIEIFNSKIAEISAKAFKGATYLREISLRQCSVDKIDKNAFADLPNLKKIKIKGTKFDNYFFLHNLPKSVEKVEF